MDLHATSAPVNVFANPDGQENIVTNRAHQITTAWNARNSAAVNMEVLVILFPANATALLGGKAHCKIMTFIFQVFRSSWCNFKEYMY